MPRPARKPKKLKVLKTLVFSDEQKAERRVRTEALRLAAPYWRRPASPTPSPTSAPLPPKASRRLLLAERQVAAARRLAPPIVKHTPCPDTPRLSVVFAFTGEQRAVAQQAQSELKQRREERKLAVKAHCEQRAALGKRRREEAEAAAKKSKRQKHKPTAAVPDRVTWRVRIEDEVTSGNTTMTMSHEITSLTPPIKTCVQQAANAMRRIAEKRAKQRASAEAKANGTAPPPRRRGKKDTSATATPEVPVLFKPRRITPPGTKPKPGDRSPWWDDSLKSSVYDRLPREAPDANDQQVDLPLLHADGKQQPKSWFSVKAIPLASASTGPGGDDGPSWRANMHLKPDDVWSAETGAGHKAATARKGKELAPEPLKQQRCRKIRIRFATNEERRSKEKLLKTWMSGAMYTYNAAVALVRKNKKWLFGDNGQLLKEQLVNESCYDDNRGQPQPPPPLDVDATEEAIAEHAVAVEAHAEALAKHTGYRAGLVARRKALGVNVGAFAAAHPWLAAVPTRVRKSAIRDVVKAEKSNQGMRDANPNHRWTLKFKNKKSPSAWTIEIAKDRIHGVQVRERPTARRPRTDGSDHVETNVRKWTRVVVGTRRPEKGEPKDKHHFEFWLNEPVPGGTITADCRLSLDKCGRFYLSVPYEIEATPPTTTAKGKRRVGADDQGNRIGHSVCSPHEGLVVQYAVGKEGGGKDRIFEEAFKLDAMIAAAERRRVVKPPSEAKKAELEEAIAPLKAEYDALRTDQNLTPKRREELRKPLRERMNTLRAPLYRASKGLPGDSPSQRRMRRHQLAKQRARMKDLVTEAHHKIALDMVRRWDTLILPSFETHGMTKKRQREGGARKINSRTARMLLSWRSYEFSIHAKNVFLRAGKELVSPDERYTTMACGACGTLGEKHSKEEWTCTHCDTFHLRDPAAARCILIRCLAPLPEPPPPPSPPTDAPGSSGSSDTAVMDDYQMDTTMTTTGEIQPTSVLTTTTCDPRAMSEEGSMQ